MTHNDVNPYQSPGTDATEAKPPGLFHVCAMLLCTVLAGQGIYNGLWMIGDIYLYVRMRNAPNYIPIGDPMWLASYVVGTLVVGTLFGVAANGWWGRRTKRAAILTGAALCLRSLLVLLV